MSISTGIVKTELKKRLQNRDSLELRDMDFIIKVIADNTMDDDSHYMLSLLLDVLTMNGEDN